LCGRVVGEWVGGGDGLRAEGGGVAGEEAQEGVVSADMVVDVVGCRVVDVVWDIV